MFYLVARAIAPIVLGLVLSACATEAEKHEANAAWAQCVQRQVALLDDGRSDVTSIGAATLPACAVEGLHADRASGVRLSEHTRIELAAAAVALHRRQQLSQSHQ